MTTGVDGKSGFLFKIFSGMSYLEPILLSPFELILKFIGLIDPFIPRDFSFSRKSELTIVAGMSEDGKICGLPASAPPDILDVNTSTPLTL